MKPATGRLAVGQEVDLALPAPLVHVVAGLRHRLHRLGYRRRLDGVLGVVAERVLDFEAVGRRGASVGEDSRAHHHRRRRRHHHPQAAVPLAPALPDVGQTHPRRQRRSRQQLHRVVGRKLARRLRRGLREQEEGKDQPGEAVSPHPQPPYAHGGQRPEHQPAHQRYRVQENGRYQLAVQRELPRPLPVVGEHGVPEVVQGSMNGEVGREGRCRQHSPQRQCAHRLRLTLPLLQLEDEQRPQPRPVAHERPQGRLAGKHR